MPHGDISNDVVLLLVVGPDWSRSRSCHPLYCWPALTRDYVAKDVDIGPVRFSYNPYFSACFSVGTVFSLSQQISKILVYFSAKRTGPLLLMSS